jgi:hypothetical protein
MDQKWRTQALTAIVAVALFTVTGFVLFASPGHLVVSLGQPRVPALTVCPAIGGQEVPVACETVKVTWPSTFPPCVGSVSSYVVHDVTFALQPFVNCGGFVGRGLNVTVTGSTGSPYEFQLDEGAPPVI